MSYFQMLVDRFTHEVKMIQLESRPRHMILGRKGETDTLTINMATPVEAPAFFLDSTKPLEDGYLELNREEVIEFVMSRLEFMTLELTEALLDVLLTQGTGANYRFITDTEKDHVLVTSARMVAIILIEPVPNEPTVH